MKLSYDSIVLTREEVAVADISESNDVEAESAVGAEYHLMLSCKLVISKQVGKVEADAMMS